MNYDILHHYPTKSRLVSKKLLRSSRSCLQGVYNKIYSNNGCIKCNKRVHMKFLSLLCVIKVSAHSMFFLDSTTNRKNGSDDQKNVGLKTEQGENSFSKAAMKGL